MSRRRIGSAHRTGAGARVWAASLLAGILAGCAGNAVVLVPDPDGRVGAAEVRTAAGSRQLVRSGDMTRIRGRDTAPTDVVTAGPAYLARTFTEAQAAEPPPPESFTLYFETGSPDIRLDGSAELDAIAATVKRRAALQVRISGHTDATGSDRINEELSRARAERVRSLLVERGVDAQRITVSHHGKGNPAFPTPEGVAEPRNRRVVVIVR